MIFNLNKFQKETIANYGDLLKESGIDLKVATILPSFCDVHVHFREPGYEYKETIKSGMLSALAGGYTTVFTMPNLNPVPDTLDNLNVQLEKIKSSSDIQIVPYGAITKGQSGNEIADFYDLAPKVCAFSDDGRGVQNGAIMKTAMQKAKELDKIIVAHCEDNSLLNGGYVHDGKYAKENGHKGISSASEYAQVERDLELVKQTGVKYHVCHVSTKESVALIKTAKQSGANVTCETAPHYLYFNDSMLKDSGNFKMNPPIREESDRLALINGIKDGTIDMIATDHAPHSHEEKSKGLKGSLNGIVGLETAFSALYTSLVKSGEVTLEKIVELLSVNPRNRFSIGKINGFTVWNLNESYVVKGENFYSKGKSTPFENEVLYGKLLMTVCDGKILFKEGKYYGEKK